MGKPYRDDVYTTQDGAHDDKETTAEEDDQADLLHGLEG